MPRLVWSSETIGCGATIELDSSEVVVVSIAQVGVMVRLWEMRAGLIRRVMSNFFGARLYNESSVYKNARTARALSMMFPEQAPPLQFKNPVLAAFSNAIWHCGTAAEVCTVLNQAAAKIPKIDRAAESGLQRTLEAAKNWPPKRPTDNDTGNLSSRLLRRNDARDTPDTQ
jgi:hypothetical protein